MDTYYNLYDPLLLDASFADAYSDKVVDSVDIRIYLLNSDITITPTLELEVLGQLVPDSDQEFTYLWVPTVAGDYRVDFVGHYSASTPSQTIIITGYYPVGRPSQRPVESLGADHIYVFIGDLQPLYADPEALRLEFTEDSLADITEAVYQVSLEIDHFLKKSEPTYLINEYAYAASACLLSRRFGMDSTVGAHVALGDFSVDRSPVMGNRITRANAKTWCELAAALRQEMIEQSRLLTGGIKAVRKGSNFPNPMRPRYLRSRDIPINDIVVQSRDGTVTVLPYELPYQTPWPR